MKATTATTYRSLLGNINRVSDRLNDLRLQSATGKKMTTASDQPTAVRPVLLNRSQMASSARQIEASQKALDRVDTMDSHFSSMEDLLQRAKEIALAANNSSVSQADRNSYANEVVQLKAQLLTTANAQVGGQYLFAGFADDAAPFASNPTSINSVAYQGDSRDMELEIGPNARVTVNHTGSSLFLGQEDTDGDGKLETTGVDLFEMLSNLERALRGQSGQILDATGSVYPGVDAVTQAPILLDEFGDPVLDTDLNPIPLLHNGEPIRLSPQLDTSGNPVLDSLTGKPVYLHADGTPAIVDAAGDPIFYDDLDFAPHSLLDAAGNPIQLAKVPTLDALLDTIDAGAEQLRYQRSASGHVGTRLEAAISHLQDVQLDLTESLSNYEDADLLAVFTEMTKQESALEAALNVTGRISQLSILDYL
jgi:flagellar hook-associated protein 3 FlgL